MVWRGEEFLDKKSPVSAWIHSCRQFGAFPRRHTQPLFLADAQLDVIRRSARTVRGLVLQQARQQQSAAGFEEVQQRTRQLNQRPGQDIGDDHIGAGSARPAYRHLRQGRLRRRAVCRCGWRCRGWPPGPGGHCLPPVHPAPQLEGGDRENARAAAVIHDDWPPQVACRPARAGTERWWDGCRCRRPGPDPAAG